MSTADTALQGDADTPSVRTDILYSLINLGSTVLWSIVSGWLLYFYLPPAGEGSSLVPAALYGVTILSIRVITAFLAPGVGHLSDHSRSRYGRRLPLMLGSALPMAVSFVLLWTPPVQRTSGWNLIYLGIVFLIYNLAYTVNQVPYMALLPELARSDRHRVRMSAWASSFFLLGMMVGAAAGPLIAYTTYRFAALVYAGLALPLLCLPCLGLEERDCHQIHPDERLTLRDGVTIMLRNRAFLILTATGILYWSVTTFVQSIVPFVVTEICQLTKTETIAFYIPAVTGSLACYPLLTWMSDRWGKSTVFSASLLASAVALPGLMAIGPWFPLSLKSQGIVWITLQAVTMAGVTMLPPAFGAEITDHDETLTGQRREGAYYATWGLLDQAINGVASALLPLILLLGRSQSDPRGPLGVRLVGPLSGILMLVAFLIFRGYPFRHKKLGKQEVNDDPYAANR